MSLFRMYDIDDGRNISYVRNISKGELQMVSRFDFRQAAENCNRIAKSEYDECIASGCSEHSAREAARKTYEAEMRWYESTVRGG
jgi:hypothetical protein